MTRGHNEHLSGAEIEQLKVDLRAGILTLEDLNDKYHLSPRNIYSYRKKFGITTRIRTRSGFGFRQSKPLGERQPRTKDLSKPKVDDKPKPAIMPNCIPSVRDKLMRGRA